MRGTRARAACLALAGALGVVLATGLAACGSGTAGGPVTVLIPWAASSSEYTAFQRVVTQFTNRNGIQVSLEPTRGLTEQLNTDISAGDPPDIADLPNPSAVYQYQEHGLVPATSVSLKSYDEPWRSLAEQPGSNEVLAVPVKADIKSLLWYNTKTVASVPKTWTDLVNLSARGTPWCLGLDSEPTSGWPGADWISDILLAADGKSTYQQWLDGDLNWDSVQVRDAWQNWDNLMRGGAAVPGGAVAALTTKFNAVSAEPGCELEHGALSASGLVLEHDKLVSPDPHGHPTTNTFSYEQLPSPAGNNTSPPVMVSGDFMALFTRNPNALKLLTYLAETATQQNWVSQSGGFAFSADSQVPIRAYQDAAQRQLASGLLRQSSRTMLCFTASDMMTSDVSTEFYQEALEYLSDPSDLTTLLRDLQTTQRAGTPKNTNRACSMPGASS